MAKLKINSTYNVGNGVSYIISAAHRRKSSKKSRWTISTNEEFACFSNSITNTWKQNFSAWGLHIVNSTPDILGKGVNKEDLKVAKFVDGNKNNIWHGYPANILANKQDIPPTSILLLWEKLNYINKSDIRKINQQMPCNLQK